MKQIRQLKLQSGPSVKIYRDDIDEIIQILSKHLSGVLISDENYEYVSIEEFIKQRGTRPRYLSIKSSGYEVQLDLKHGGIISGSKLFSDGSEKANTCFFVIKDILDKRRRII
jgi:hypothetical protein